MQETTTQTTTRPHRRQILFPYLSKTQRGTLSQQELKRIVADLLG